MNTTRLRSVRLLRSSRSSPSPHRRPSLLRRPSSRSRRRRPSTPTRCSPRGRTGPMRSRDFGHGTAAQRSRLSRGHDPLSDHAGGAASDRRDLPRLHGLRGIGPVLGAVPRLARDRGDDHRHELAAGSAVRPWACPAGRPRDGPRGERPRRLAPEGPDRGRSRRGRRLVDGRRRCATRRREGPHAQGRGRLRPLATGIPVRSRSSRADPRRLARFDGVDPGECPTALRGRRRRRAQAALRDRGRQPHAPERSGQPWRRRRGVDPRLAQGVPRGGRTLPGDPRTSAEDREHLRRVVPRGGAPISPRPPSDRPASSPTPD